MQIANSPQKWTIPFANGDSGRVEVPATSVDATKASLLLGFPPLTRTPPDSGGVPPRGEDFNGAMNQVARIAWWQMGGGRFNYDAAFATDTNVNGYPQGGVLASSDQTGTWVSLIDNNTNNPDTVGTGWAPLSTYGVLALTGQTGGTTTLTPVQAMKRAITIAGTLTSNLTVVLPAWTYNWQIANLTTGAFSLTVKTAAGSGTIIPQTGTPTPVAGDGTNIASADYLRNDLASTTAGKGADLLGWPTGAEINQPATNLFFSQNGAAIQRFNDRVFIGGATINDGAFPDVSQDWLSAYQHSLTPQTGTSIAPAVRSAQAAALTNNNSNSSFGLLGAAQTQYFSSASAACIGVSSYALANNATYNAKAWAYYGEAHRVMGAAPVYGMELDTFTATASINPNSYAQGDVVGIQIGSGANVAGGVDGSAAIQIVGNHYKVKTGIVFSADAITGTDGVTGSGNAMAFAKGHALQWYATGGVATGRIISNGTTATNSPQFQLSDSAINMQARSNGAFQHIFNINDSAVNYLTYTPAATGVSPLISVGGADANIDLVFSGKGTGNIRFGTYTAGSVTQAGYITIKDYAGNTRRILVG